MLAENEPKGGKKQYGPQHDKERNWKIEFHTKKLAEHRKWGREGVITIELGQSDGREDSENEPGSTDLS